MATRWGIVLSAFQRDFIHKNFYQMPCKWMHNDNQFLLEKCSFYIGFSITCDVFLFSNITKRDNFILIYIVKSYLWNPIICKCSSRILSPTNVCCLLLQTMVLPFNLRVALIPPPSPNSQDLTSRRVSHPWHRILFAISVGTYKAYSRKFDCVIVCLEDSSTVEYVLRTENAWYKYAPKSWTVSNFEFGATNPLFWF